MESGFQYTPAPPTAQRVMVQPGGAVMPSRKFAVVVDTFAEMVLAATEAVGEGVDVLEHAAANGRTNSVTPANPMPWVFRRIHIPPAKSTAQGRISLALPQHHARAYGGAKNAYATGYGSRATKFA